MNIEAIIKSIFEAKTIKAMTVAVVALTLLAYIFNEKIGVVKSEDKVGALLILFVIVVVFVVVIAFLYGIATTKMRYEHEDRKQDAIREIHNKKEVQKAKNQNSPAKKLKPSNSKTYLPMNIQELKNLVNHPDFVMLFEKLDPLFAGNNADFQYSNIKQNILHEMGQNRSPSPTQIQSLLVFINSEKVKERLGQESKENRESTDNATYTKSNVIKGNNNGNITNNFS